MSGEAVWKAVQQGNHPYGASMMGISRLVICSLVCGGRLCGYYI
jgi:hypothetical protein